MLFAHWAYSAWRRCGRGSMALQDRRSWAFRHESQVVPQSSCYEPDESKTGPTESTSKNLRSTSGAGFSAMFLFSVALRFSEFATKTATRNSTANYHPRLPWGKEPLKIIGQNAARGWGWVGTLAGVGVFSRVPIHIRAKPIFLAPIPRRLSLRLCRTTGPHHSASILNLGSEDQKGFTICQTRPE